MCISSNLAYDSNTTNNNCMCIHLLDIKLKCLPPRACLCQQGSLDNMTRHQRASGPSASSSSLCIQDTLHVEYLISSWAPTHLRPQPHMPHTVFTSILYTYAKIQQETVPHGCTHKAHTENKSAEQDTGLCSVHSIKGMTASPSLIAS